jgi:hypothetical protein
MPLPCEQHQGQAQQTPENARAVFVSWCGIKANFSQQHSSYRRRSAPELFNIPPTKLRPRTHSGAGIGNFPASLAEHQNKFAKVPYVEYDDCAEV